jgi:hypothetical protein
MNIEQSSGQLPVCVRWHIRRCLAWINPADIADIGLIQIEARMPGANPDGPSWHQRVTSENLSVCGLYFAAGTHGPATIKLFIRDLYRGIPKIYWPTPVVTLNIARTLAHEVGHHLIAKRGFVFAPGEKVSPADFEEEMANRYAHMVLQKMKHRWYYRVGERATKDLAGSHYIKGIINWRSGDYERAAENWYRSFCLDPDREDAIHWYKRAREVATERVTSK